MIHGKNNIRHECDIEILRLSSKGEGVGNCLLPGKEKEEPIALPLAIPGDHWHVALGKRRRRKLQVLSAQLLHPSEHRVPPRCAHTAECGGCSLQQLEYGEQLKEREKGLKKAFGALLEDSQVQFHPILPCSDPWQYRNKMEFSFSQDREGRRFLGLFMRKSRGKVFNLHECALVSNWFSQTLSAVRKWWESTTLAAYHPPTNEGTLRTLILREGKRTQDKLALLTVSGNPTFAMKKDQLASFVEALVTSTKESEKLSIFLRIQQIAKGKETQSFEMHLSGKDHYTEKLFLDTPQGKRALEFKISPASFFQPNPLQAEKLYSRALEMASLSPNSIVFDLYAGMATLGMAAALIAKHVIAIECNPYAVFDAEINRERNGITNLELHCGDVAAVLNKLQADSAYPSLDLAILDPPRCGLSPQALEAVVRLSAKKILYVSCNPATAAQNISLFKEKNYQLKELQPVDQFPHTMHLETIALLEKS